MTIKVAPTRNEYIATASQSIFTYTFKIFASTDLNVYVTPAGQACDDATDLTTAYTVTGVGDEDGGSITLNTPASVGDLVTIVSNITSNRTTDYQNNGDFIPDTVNDDFDRVVSLVKQVEEQSNRTLVSKECLQGPKPLTLPNPSSGLYLRWKADLSGVENAGAPSVATDTIEFNVVADMVASTTLNVGDIVDTGGYRTLGDPGNNRYEVVAAGTGTDDGGSFIDLDTHQAKALFPGGQINVMQFNAAPGVAADQSTAVQAAIDYAESSNLQLNITADQSGNLDYRVDVGLTMDANDLAVDFLAGAHIKPVNSALLRPLTIGSTSEPSRMIINNPSVIRDAFDGGTENDGITFLEMNQCTINNAESRLSKYNLHWDSTTAGHAYNTFINPQGIGGFYNMWLEGTGATTFINENTFLGGRMFTTADTDTNLRISTSATKIPSHNRFISMSLEGVAVQGVFDDGDSNVFYNCRSEGTWSNPAGAFHVYGDNCVRPTVESSRIDYIIDRNTGNEPVTGRRDTVLVPRSGSQLTSAINELTTLTLENRSANRGSTLDMRSTRDNADAFVFRAIRQISVASGAHDGAANAAVLTDSGESFTVDEFVGDIIFNETDGSSAIVTSNTATTVTGVLAGGIDNDWDVGDTYVIYQFNAKLLTDGSFILRRRMEIEQSGFNFNPFQMGSDYFWIDGNFFRHHGVAPAAATDGRIIVENQTSVAAGLGNIANVVNTTDKYTGKEVFDTGLNRPVWAVGSTAGSIWVFSDGTTAYTPV